MRVARGISTIATLLGSVVLLVVLYVIFQKRIQATISSIRNRGQAKDEKKMLEQMGMKLSYAPSWYTTNAQKLYEYVHYGTLDWNCNESGTQGILMKLNNDLDYLELYMAFGVKDSWDLSSWVYGCLNQGEIQKINQVWLTKGITKRL
jgi:hypothetical protein